MKTTLQLLLLILLITIASNPAHAQFPPEKKMYSDSLWQIWNNTSQPDTSRCKAMDKIADNGYLYSQPDSAFYFAQLSYDFAQTKGLKQHMANALNTQGTSYYVQGDYPSAVSYYTKS